MKIIVTRRFDREIDRLVKKRLDIAKRVEKTLALFSSNPHHPSLRLHKISRDGVYSLSVDMDLRILVLWEDDQSTLLRIGTHKDVY
ncbi:plasmid stabilization protein [Candidatus Gottesmanbacteria bacterium]|nr:plasmid stabilization protein [Candidatus Gottesmanbacteria bacterium]